MNGECPSCGDILVGYELREAMKHLQMCDSEPGSVVLGVKPRYADKLYRNLTDNRTPNLRQVERMEFYFGYDD